MCGRESGHSDAAVLMGCAGAEMKYSAAIMRGCDCEGTETGPGCCYHGGMCGTEKEYGATAA
eukprot:3931916-Rhodomonas_salina.5